MKGCRRKMSGEKIHLEKRLLEENKINSEKIEIVLKNKTL